MWSDPLQLVAVALILFFFVVSSFGIGQKQGVLAQLASIAPNTLTSIGIFFTFVGILIALSNFSVTDINQSIPRLLDGLKLAFLSSVVGLGASVGFRFSQALVGREGSSGELGAIEIHDQLKDLNTNTLAVRDALIGEGDASLSTQFGKLRNDFRDFADKMKEDGTEALVKALEEVIRDFNAKISEQFGENFKQLNEAVGALLKWQEEYKAQVESLTQAFKETQAGMQNIEETTAKIPTHMQEVESAFREIQTATEKIGETTSLIPQHMSAVESVFKDIQAGIESVEETTSKVPEHMQAVEAVFSESRTGIQNIEQTAAKIPEHMQSVETVFAEIQTGIKNVEQTTAKIPEHMSSVDNSFKEIQQGIHNVEETTAKIPSHMESVETAFIATEARVEELYEGVGSLNEMRESAKNAVPELKNSIDLMTSGMRESIDSQMEVVRSQMVDLKEAQSKTSQEIRDLTANLGDIVKSSLDQSEQNFARQMEKFQVVLDSLNLGADNVLESTETVAKRVNEIIDDFSSRQEKVSREVQSRIDQSAADNVEAMNQSLQELDKGMQQQLQRSIDKMGNNLTAITETFVNTYEENARKVVELTRSLNR